MTDPIERTAPKTHREVIAMRLFELQMIGGSRFTYWHLLDPWTRDRWLYAADEVIRMTAPTLKQNETLREQVATLARQIDCKTDSILKIPSCDQNDPCRACALALVRVLNRTCPDPRCLR
jgi:hypothetical protein